MAKSAMRVLVTGHDGYIGVVLCDLLTRRGFSVSGVDTFFFHPCTIGPEPTQVSGKKLDTRDVTVQDLQGFDAVIHLAALCNDPLGNVNPELTYAINLHATVDLARKAKEAGIKRFVFASSCSVYGAGQDELVGETGQLDPLTPYAVSKVKSEEELSKLADANFAPVYMRNATAYGFSPRLRSDIVVNNLTAYALTTGKVCLNSDGMAWRPLAHILDLSEACIAVLEAPLDVIRDQAFNIGAEGENYLVKDIAEMVKAIVPNSTVTFATGSGADNRNYRVSFAKLAKTFPDLKLTWTVEKGIRELTEKLGGRLTRADFEGGKFTRLSTLKHLLESGRLDADFRWQDHAASGASEAARAVGA